MQELFDKMVNHLRAQGCTAKTAGKGVYRTTDGLKCPVGILISDEHYYAALEGGPVWSTRIRIAIELSNPDFKFWESKWLLQCMQSLHDNHDPKVWEKHFEGIAFRHKLDYKEA